MRRLRGLVIRLKKSCKLFDMRHDMDTKYYGDGMGWDEICIMSVYLVMGGSKRFMKRDCTVFQA